MLSHLYTDGIFNNYINWKYSYAFVFLFRRKVSHEEGVKFMNDNGMVFFFETSAADGTNVDKVRILQL